MQLKKREEKKIYIRHHTNSNELKAKLARILCFLNRSTSGFFFVLNRLQLNKKKWFLFSAMNSNDRCHLKIRKITKMKQKKPQKIVYKSKKIVFSLIICHLFLMNSSMFFLKANSWRNIKFPYLVKWLRTGGHSKIG